MQYVCDIVINLPRERVIELFDNAENLGKWQKTLLRVEPIEGEPGQEGTRSLMVYDNKGKELAVNETITTRRFPEEFSAIYEAGGVWNDFKNFFYQTDDDKTRWECVAVFKFKGFFKVIAFFFPGMFKRNTQQLMQDFKNFAETAGDSPVGE